MSKKPYIADNTLVVSASNRDYLCFKLFSPIDKRLATTSDKVDYSKWEYASNVLLSM